MKVKLEQLHPNPLRDFPVDPISREVVDALKNSIDESGFWGGVVCRRRNGRIEIGAGHHRVIAALELGIREADLSVVDVDDVAVIRIYGLENGTHRGNLGTARTGTVAAALRLAARATLKGELPGLIVRTDAYQDGSDLAGIPARSVETIEGNLVGKQGIGWVLLLRMLNGLPGVNKNTVEQDVKNLKTGGHYARIVGEEADAVQAALDAARAAAEAEEKAAAEAAEAAAREAARAEKDRAAKAAASRAEHKRKATAEGAKTARARAERAPKAKQAAAEHNPTIFDHSGVSKHLRNPHQVDVFREIVLSTNLREILGYKQHEPLAAALVAQAERLEKDELTAYFIRENLYNLALGLDKLAKIPTEEEKAKIACEGWHKVFENHQDYFMGGVRQMMKYGKALAEHMNNKPEGATARYAPGFRDAVLEAKHYIDQLAEKV
jgi:hypothetical protein